MIDFDGYWMWTYHDKKIAGVHYLDNVKRPEYLEHWGKWLVFGSLQYLITVSSKIDPFVESGEIDCIKYNGDPLEGRTECVLCVYCDDRDRDRVWAILERCGVQKRIWKYDAQTIKDWKPGGKLYEEVRRAKLK